MIQREVTLRLESLGYNVDFADEEILLYLQNKIERELCNACNTSKVPDGLHYAVVERICGELLKSKYQTGRLNQISVQPAIKSISDGDTSITYSEADSSQKQFNTLISNLSKSGANDIPKFRKLKW